MSQASADLANMMRARAQADSWSNTPNVQLLTAGATEIDRLNALTGGKEGPEGYVLVPKKANEKMIKAGDEWTEVSEIWDAMVQAAGEVPEVKEEQPEEQVSTDRGGPPLPGTIATGSNQMRRR